MKHSKPVEKIALKLTAAERTLLLDKPVVLPPAFERLIESTPISEPLLFLPDSLVALVVYVGVAADRTPDKKLKKKLNAIVQRIMQLLSDHREATAVKVHEPIETKLPAGQATGLAKRRARTKKPTDRLYQFKITLLGANPLIWRRIQVKDSTLDKLHKHIQTAMGWTNSHPHQFKIGAQLYGNPMLIGEDFEEFGYQDSTTTNLSDILPKTGNQQRFIYEYDFGDFWTHDILLEDCPQAESGNQYPCCLEGSRACPPEDVGGVRRYGDFLIAIQDPNHGQHEEMLEWIGSEFDPEAFDPAAASKRMKKGLPAWRRRMV